MWRFDGGAGSDENIRWLLQRGYHVMGKGHSHRRANAWARLVRRWDPYQDHFLGFIVPPIEYPRPVQVLVKKRPNKDKFHYSYYISTLEVPSKRRLMALYDNRGAAEVEQFRTDKSGLHLQTRQKGGFMAQLAIILLTDLAHNLLADLYNQALVHSRFRHFGPQRIVNQLLNIPGTLHFEHGQLKSIQLLENHQHAPDMHSCLEKYYQANRNPSFLQ